MKHSKQRDQRAGNIWHLLIPYSWWKLGVGFCCHWLLLVSYSSPEKQVFYDCLGGGISSDASDLKSNLQLTLPELKWLSLISQYSKNHLPFKPWCLSCKPSAYIFILMAELYSQYLLLRWLFKAEKWRQKSKTSSPKPIGMAGHRLTHLRQGISCLL